MHIDVWYNRIMKTTLTEGRYAGNLEFIGKLLLEGGYQSFIDWLLEQDETRQLDVVYMMALFAKETSVLVSEKSRGEKSPATLATQSLKVRSLLFVYLEVYRAATYMY